MAQQLKFGLYNILFQRLKKKIFEHNLKVFFLGEKKKGFGCKARIIGPEIPGEYSSHFRHNI